MYIKKTVNHRKALQAHEIVWTDRLFGRGILEGREIRFEGANGPRENYNGFTLPSRYRPTGDRPGRSPHFPLGYENAITTGAEFDVRYEQLARQFTITGRKSSIVTDLYYPIRDRCIERIKKAQMDAMERNHARKEARFARRAH